MAHQFDLPTNRLYQIRDGLIAKRIPFIDLVTGNVNAHGISFPGKLLHQATAEGTRASRIYRPDPLGQAVAREAISGFYAREGLKIPSSQILLTPGTSVSYWYVFKLLANAGDEILAPIPSYPLFDAIARLCGVKLVPYPLRERARWEVDMGDLEKAITPRTKAIILISPHNPTGAVATMEEVQRLGEIAARRGLTIISDEVFASFLYNRADLARPAETSAPLVLTMNGLSKMMALPGLKIGWLAVSGDPSLVKKSMKTLEMISDTFLPVNEPAQFSLPAILKKGAPFQRSYLQKMRQRMKMAMDILTPSSELSIIGPEGGFFLTVKLNRSGANEEEIVCRLLSKHRVLVHPGYFYDMEGQHLVLSFVSRPAVLQKAINVILRDWTR